MQALSRNTGSLRMIRSGLKSPRAVVLRRPAVVPAGDEHAAVRERARVLAVVGHTAISEFSFAAPALNTFVGSTTTALLIRVSMPSSDS